MKPFHPAPKPPKRRRHPSGYIPPAVKRAVIKRSIERWESQGFYITDTDEQRGLCENPGCPDPRGGGHLEWCHRYATGQRTKGMGGTKRVCTVEDVWRGCHKCHFSVDHP